MALFWMKLNSNYFTTIRDYWRWETLRVFANCQRIITGIIMWKVVWVSKIVSRFFLKEFLWKIVTSGFTFIPAHMQPPISSFATSIYIKAWELLKATCNERTINVPSTRRAKNLRTDKYPNHFSFHSKNDVKSNRDYLVHSWHSKDQPR